MSTESQIERFNRISKEETEIVNTMVRAQSLADAVVDAAIDWHKSDMEESMDAAQTLEDAIEELLEFRRKMPIVKSQGHVGAKWIGMTPDGERYTP